MNEYGNYYIILAVILAVILAQNRTIRNRGYDLERALRIRLVECVSQLVVFLSLSFIFIGWIIGNMWLASFIILFELIIMFEYERGFLVGQKEKRLKKVTSDKEKDIKGNAVVLSENRNDHNSNKYYQYVIGFLSYFISILVPFLFILADFIFNVLNQEYAGFPIVLNVMKNENWINIIIGLSLINIILLNQRYVLIRRDVNENQISSQEIKDEEKRKFNEWYASIEHDDKKI